MAKPAPNLDYYRRVLQGERVPMYAEDPQHGYYRFMDSPVAIYPGEHGDTVVEVGGITLTDPEKIQNAWIGSASKPIEAAIFKHRISSGLWPEQLALIEKSSSLAADLKSLALLTKKHIDKLRKKAAAMEEGELVIDSQLEADTAAGFVQQIRAMTQTAEETIKLQVAPLKQQEKVIKEVWVDPFEALDASKKFLLEHIAAFGIDQRKKTNNPETFKFAAGKAGDGKTISLRKREQLVVEDYNVLMRKFGKDPKVIEAMQKALFDLASAAWKAEKVAPKGTKVSETFTAE